MKKYIILTILFLSSVAINAQEYTLDIEKSNAIWTGYGEIGGFLQTGSIDLMESKISIVNNMVVTGKIIFDAKSIQHENKDLQKHLRAKDFFYVKKHSQITFEIKSVDGNIVKGLLTIRGITNEENLEFSMIKNKDRLTFQGKASIDRTKYDIKYNSSSYFQDLGNYAIKNDFDLEFELVFKPNK